MALILVGSLAVVASLAACGDTAQAPAAEPPEQIGFGGADGSAKAETSTPDDECAEENKDVFVIDDANGFHSFHPPSLEFKKIGTLDCPTGARPDSMSVDRKGTAWVRFNDGHIWTVNTKTLRCTATGYEPDSTTAFFKFGMGFSSVSKGSSLEGLYISDNQGPGNSAGLGRYDTEKSQSFFIGSYSGALAGQPSELTGTGDGRLFGFFTTEPAQIAEISKKNGDIIDRKELTGVSAGDGWAFSFYGGEFFVYTHAVGENGGSDVTRFRFDEEEVEVVMPKIGFKIVGAGVSTCAPTEGPR